jgi:phosphate transport system substrate-binding protein
VFLIGSVAMAAALWWRGRDELTPQPAPAARVAVPSASSAPAPKAQSTSAPEWAAAQRNPLATQAAEPVADDSQRVTVLTSALARPLAQALLERLAPRQPPSVPRLTVVEADEAFEALCRGTEFVVASRRMLDVELVRCRHTGIEVAEWKLGYQAVVLTAGPLAPPVALSPREVYLGLARRIPDPADRSRLIDNPNTTWQGFPIDVLAPDDATVRELLLRLLMEPGCETFPSLRELKQRDRRRYDDACRQLRTDGRYREVPLTNTLITQQLWAEPNQSLVLGYSFFDAHRQELRTILEGAAPTRGSLEDGTYLAARPVYAYAARNRLRNPVANAFAFELSGASTAGRYGSLARLGLVPRDEADRLQEPWTLPPKLESLPSSQEPRR